MFAKKMYVLREKKLNWTHPLTISRMIPAAFQHVLEAQPSLPSLGPMKLPHIQVSSHVDQV